MLYHTGYYFQGIRGFVKEETKSQTNVEIHDSPPFLPCRVKLKKSTQLKKSIQFSGGGAPQPSVAFTDDPSMILQ